MFLLEVRPAGALHAAGQLTCFGGRREPGESVRDCARRELAEELGWVPAVLSPGVAPRVGGPPVAHFFSARLDVDPAGLRLEPGRTATLVSESQLDERPLSSWHLEVLRAYLVGRRIVEL